MSLRTPQATTNAQALAERIQRLSSVVDLLEHRAGLATGWRGLEFQTIWQNHGAGWEIGRYHLDPFGKVWVKGLVKTTGGAYAYGGANCVIANLPVGFRPTSEQMFEKFQHSSNGDQRMVRVDVQTNGNIAIIEACSEGTGAGNNGEATFLNLNGIQFYAGL